MDHIIIGKLKKYLLFLSTAFFLLFGTHLGYIYLTHDAQTQAIEGGTISEAIIGSFPHFNPLRVSNDHNDYINRLLYRSLMDYDSEKDIFIPNLASCGLEKLGYIECTLVENITWSDGSPITPNDIQATFEVIRSTQVQPILASLLQDTLIKTTGNTISFTSSTQDINLLTLLTQPILPQKIVETLSAESVEGKLSDIEGIFSGYFTVSSIFLEETTGITRITLEKNKNYKNSNIYIEYLILSLFRDEAHFLKNKNASYNIFYDKNNIVGNSIPRLERYDFQIPQFTANFYNTETLDASMRKFLISHISRENLISELGIEKVSPIYNPFFTEDIIDIPKDENFSLADYLREKSYYSKTELLKSVIAKKQITEESELFSEPKEVDSRPVQEDLTVIVSPTQKKYNFVSEDNILITGSVPAGVEAVYVGDYKLQGFSQGDKVFYYRLLRSFDSIIDGQNKYEIYFEKDGEKKLVETFFYYLEEDTQKLKEIQDNFFKQESSQANNINQTIQLEDILELRISAQEIEALPDIGYYTTDGKPYTLKMVVAQTDELMVQTQEYISDELKKIGIQLQTEILSLGNITTKLRDESLEYDFLLLGLNLGIFEGNIFSYLHSSQIKNGYNIANFGKLSLDILVEELKQSNPNAERKKELSQKILTLLREEGVIQTWYSTKQYLLIDKNIKNVRVPEKISEISLRHRLLQDMYFREEQSIQWEDKTLLGGLRYLIKILIF